jgi:hypothetical protein
MRSLNTHLRESEGHDRLPFHPDCPICRGTRLTGELAVGELAPVRAQAALAASVLALSTAGPAANALAAEQDSQQDGSAPVTQTALDPTDSPAFDPGGDSTDLPDTAPPVPQAQAPSDPGNDDAGPVDQSPATDPSDPVVDSGDGSVTATTPAASPPGAAEPSTSTSPDTPQSTTATPPAPTEPAPAQPDTAAPTSTAVQQAAPVPAEGKVKPQRRSDRAHRSQPPIASNNLATAVPSAVTAAAPPAPSPSPAPVSAVRHAKPGDRSHTVQAGESLWVIATDLLGGDATPARVARQVHRLWQLNRERIGTGDPDLLMVGTRLVLR